MHVLYRCYGAVWHAKTGHERVPEHAGPCVLGGSLAPAGLKSRLEAAAHKAQSYSHSLLLW